MDEGEEVSPKLMWVLGLQTEGGRGAQNGSAVEKKGQQPWRAAGGHCDRQAEAQPSF